MLAEAMARCFFDGEPSPEVFELVLSNGMSRRVPRWSVLGAERSVTVRFEFPEGGSFDSVALLGDGRELSRVGYSPPVQVPPGGEFVYARSFGVSEV